MTHSSTDFDAYEVLGVSHTAPDSVVKAAYKARIRETHPDSGGDPAEAKRVNEAYDILTDPVRRAQHRAAPSPTAAPAASAEPSRPSPPASSPSTAGEVPEPGYTVHGPAKSILRSPTLWVAAAITITLGALASGLVGAAVTAAGLLLALTGSIKRKLVALILVVPLMGTGWPNIVPSYVAAIALAVTVIMAIIAKRRWRKRMFLHLQDVFITTMDTYQLPHYLVADISVTQGGMSILHLEGVNRPPEWPLPTCRDDGWASIGDHVLVHGGQIIAHVTPEMLDAH